MKKLLCLSLTFAMIIILSACGGAHDKSEIHAKNLITNENLSIDLNVVDSPDTGGSTYFYSDLAISPLADEIAKDEDVASAKVQDGEYIVIEGKKCGTFLIRYLDTREEDYHFHYEFLAPVWYNTYNFPIFVPIQYFQSAAAEFFEHMEGSDAKLEYEFPCKIGYYITDFRDFYLNTGIYDVKNISDKKTDALIITEKSSGTSFVLELCGDYPGAPTAKFTFSEYGKTEGKKWFRFFLSVY